MLRFQLSAASRERSLALTPKDESLTEAAPHSTDQQKTPCSAHFKSAKSYQFNSF